MAAVTPQVLDSSALQNIASAMPDFVGSTANAYKLKDMADTSQMNTLKLAEAKRDITVREQTNEALRNLPLNATQEQRMQALEKIRQGPGGYAASMDVMRSFGEQDKAAADKAELEARTKEHLSKASQQTFESYVAKNDAFDGSFLPVWQKFNDLVATGMPTAQAKAAVQPDYQRAYVGAISATDAAGNLIYNDPGSKQKFQSLGTTFDPDKLGPEIMQSEKVRKQLADAKKERDESKYKAAETQRAQAGTAKDIAETKKIEAQIPLLGGGGAGGGREGVMINRVIASANEASAAISNIAQLPVGASAGTMGIGGGPGHSVLASARDTLRNKLASQDVQDYNTMLPGIKRNLATIESSGLAPSGALTEGFAALELRDGDTEITKLRKMAEMRQIVEKGLEPNLANPRVPEQQKKLIRDIIGEVTKSVPYTQSDITELQKRQRKDEKITLTDLMKEKGLGEVDQSQPQAGIKILKFDASGNAVQ